MRVAGKVSRCGTAHRVVKLVLGDPRSSLLRKFNFSTINSFRKRIDNRPCLLALGPRNPLVQV